ncbi:hypothetical protein BMF94_0946 [Rhodotorula taiwanensis]|uniref:PHD-type domain-containing protein n=1 Tax=Rhodotorula taiwanensis TaxID=741276 RepID=A0A2S5BGH1_9BASI|nr:hypothetical protein BMF94_0946 [Rhodotorula taiwanensis]
MAATPRPTKRRRTTGPSDAVQLDRNASVDDERVDDSDADHNTNSTLAAAPALLDKGKARATDQDALPDEEEGTALPDLEEMERIYDMLAEEYHDSESPSLSLARIHGLELKICPQSSRTSDFKSALQDYITSTVQHPPPPPPRDGPVASTSATPSAAPSPAPSTSASTTATDEPAALRAALVGRDKLLKIAELATGAVRAGEDKVGLAITLYQTVDRHIQRLDADLARYEDSLVIGLRDGTVPSHDAPSAMRKSPPGPTTSLGAIALGEKEAYANGSGSATAAAAAGGVAGPGRARRGGATAAADDGKEVAAPGAGATPGGGPRSTRKKPQRTAEDLEKEREWKRRKELLKHERAQKKREEDSGMPIDPNEPLYCYCNRVSFGEMIACENEDCDREWFHLECVGLDKAPEGQWYCDDCVEKLDIDPATMDPR